MQQNQNEVDVNILVSLYHQKMSNLTNQIILLEAKIQTLSNDFSLEKEQLLKENLDLKDKIHSLEKVKKSE